MYVDDKDMLGEIGIARKKVDMDQGDCNYTAEGVIVMVHMQHLKVMTQDKEEMSKAVARQSKGHDNRMYLQVFHVYHHYPYQQL